jgi:hypothetical protein
MNSYTYNSYSDQVNIINYIVNNNYKVREEDIVLDGIKYTKKLLKLMK